MKTGTVLVAAMFALTSFPIVAQQPPMDSPSNSPSAPESSPPAARPDAAPAEAPSASPEASAVPAAPAVELRAVKAELVAKLDTKTAKTGDNVVAETKASVKTADGTEIPKGSKLMGSVVAVQASEAGQNAQVALKFDHVELKGGESLPIHSEIQSIGPPAGETSASDSGAMSSGSMSSPATGGSSAGSASGAAQPGTGTTAATPGYAPGYTPGTTASGSGPAAGTIVARNGKIAIRATSVPGVLLANNAPGERDPRMSQTSGILLGAKKDVQLEGGTQMTVGVAAAPGGGTQ